VTFVGVWGSTEAALEDAGGAALKVVLVGSLEPGNSTFLSVTYKATNNGQTNLPDKVRVVVDGVNSERECIESNNSAEAPVQAGSARADLRLVLGAATAPCPNASVAVTVFNDGSLPASNVVVRFFAGDPAQGGTKLHDETIPGPIGPGQNAQLTVAIPNLPVDRSIVIYGMVDPDNAVPECNEANNVDQADNAVICREVPE
jgi:hypothetical protein